MIASLPTTAPTTRPLFEDYRPSSFDDVCGQDKAIKRLQAIGRRGYGGKAIWFAGQSGTGKTTLSYIVAEMVADPFCIDEIDAAELTPARLKEIERGCQTYGMGEKSGRCYIVNESHGLRKDTIRQLLVTLERIPSHVTWIFTTTNDGQELLFDGIDAGPLFSRCLPIKLAQRGLATCFAERARSIAIRESLAEDTTPVGPFLKCVKENRNNMRAVLQAVESGAFLD